nr:Histone acetyltransferase [Ipomoea batatas]
MPRPGPRPYECVRRAWHSDRHQPMRGSLIQEIFRIVNESHSSATKKNKEWQEKLPIVVLKAEEIMYFKANSEAEYIDLKTLWDRVNDAIDTIIKRDESTETGELLQPCIEAALHLGCTPRRTSRSQRNNSTVCYLGSREPEAPSSSPISLRDKIHGKANGYSPFVPTDVRFMTTPNAMNPAAFHSFETDTSRVQNHISSSSDKRFPFLPGCVSQRLPTSPSSHSVYPLYFGSEFHLADDSRCDNKSLLGPHQLKDDDARCIWKNASLQSLGDACHAPPRVNSLADPTRAPVNQTGTECDLSLRLGPVGVPCTSGVNTLLQQEKHNGDPGMPRDGTKLGSRDGTKLGYPPPHVDASFSFVLNNGGVNDQLAPASRKASSQPCQPQPQDPHLEAMLKKQKVVSHLYDDRQFCYPLKLPFNHFVGKMRNSRP